MKYLSSMYISTIDEVSRRVADNSISAEEISFARKCTQNRKSLGPVGFFLENFVRNSLIHSLSPLFEAMFAECMDNAIL